MTEKREKYEKYDRKKKKRKKVICKDGVCYIVGD